MWMDGHRVIILLIHPPMVRPTLIWTTFVGAISNNNNINQDINLSSGPLANGTPDIDLNQDPNHLIHVDLTMAAER